MTTPTNNSNRHIKFENIGPAPENKIESKVNVLNRLTPRQRSRSALSTKRDTIAQKVNEKSRVKAYNPMKAYNPEKSFIVPFLASPSLKETKEKIDEIDFFSEEKSPPISLTPSATPSPANSEEMPIETAFLFEKETVEEFKKETVEESENLEETKTSTEEKTGKRFNREEKALAQTARKYCISLITMQKNEAFEVFPKMLEHAKATRKQDKFAALALLQNMRKFPHVRPDLKESLEKIYFKTIDLFIANLGSSFSNTFLDFSDTKAHVFRRRTLLMFPSFKLLQKHEAVGKSLCFVKARREISIKLSIKMALCLSSSKERINSFSFIWIKLVTLIDL